jgi:hypothetical protein
MHAAGSFNGRTGGDAIIATAITRSRFHVARDFPALYGLLLIRLIDIPILWPEGQLKEEDTLLPNRIVVLGNIMLALGAVVAVIGASNAIHTPSAFAQQDPCASPDPTPDPTVDIEVTILGEQENECIPDPSGGPRLTPSVGPTDTPEPEPTEPPAPAATSTPSGDAGAGGVAPPNTGDGSGTAHASTAALVAGWLLLVSGAGLVAVEVRRRI